MAAPTPKNIVILGGSYGGISTAHYLLKHALPALPSGRGYQVVLISASTQVLCRPACPRACISDDMFDQTKLFVDIESCFAQYSKADFRFVEGTATAVDHGGRTVSFTTAGATQHLDFHALVIATGASTASPLFGLNRDADFLRSSWATFRTALGQARSIVIAGGGPAAVETAGELGEHLNGKPGWLSTTAAEPRVKITVVTSAPDILPNLRPAIAKKAEGYLARLGVTVLKNTRVEAVSPETAGSRDVGASAEVTLDDGRILQADLYITATGTLPNSLFLDEKLRNADGRINTNAATLRVDKAGPRIYAVGDVSSFARPAVHNIMSAIPVLGANIKRDLLLDAGKAESDVGPDREFKEDTRETQLVPVGRSGGVGAFLGYQVPSSMVWLIKGRDYWLGSTGSLWSGKHWAKQS